MAHRLKWLDRKHLEQDVEDELQLHIDLLTQQNLQQGLSFEEARESALKRFGNMREVKNECVKICDRNNTLLMLMKVGLLMIFLFGVLMRIFIPITNFMHLADVLIAVAVLGRLFIYVRGLNPSLFLPKQNTLSQLGLDKKAEPRFPNYDHQALTPLERVISDK